MEGFTAENMKWGGDLSGARIRTKVWDLETTSLKADIGSLLVAAFLDVDKSSGGLVSRTINDFDGTWEDKEEQLLMWTLEQIHDADILVGHNTKAFDRNFLNGVEFRHGLQPRSPVLHVDTYLVARYGVKGLFQSCSLSNIADVIGVGEKDRPAKGDWRKAISGDPESMERLRVRCEEDVKLNAAVWARLKPYWLLWRARR